MRINKSDSITRTEGKVSVRPDAATIIITARNRDKESLTQEEKVKDIRFSN